MLKSLYIFSWVAAAALIAGCSGNSVTPDAEAFGETADASIIPSGLESVYATLTITNNSSVRQTITWSVDCGGFGALDVRVYRVAGSARALVWDSAKQPRPLACPSQIVQRTLNSGDVALIHQTIAASVMLGDSLPPGAYTLSLQALTTPALSHELSTAPLTLINAVVDPPGVSLDGVWHGTTDGVSMVFNLTWSAASVTGTGTYAASAENTLGCGGGTLIGSGTISLAAARTPGQFAGRAVFSNGWVPPFSAIVVDANTMGASFMSIDTGPCPITLIRTP